MVLLSLAGAAGGWEAYRAGTALVGARQDVHQAVEDLDAGREEKAAEAFANAAARSREARAAAFGPVLRALSPLPVVGRPADDLQRISQAAVLLSSRAAPALLRVQRELGRGRGSGAVVDPAVIEVLRPEISSAAQAGARAVALLDKEGGGPLGGVRRDALAQARVLYRVLRGADQGAQVLPELLGRSGPRRYLVASRTRRRRAPPAASSVRTHW